jgi:hypothetical protein
MKEEDLTPNEEITEEDLTPNEEITEEDYIGTPNKEITEVHENENNVDFGKEEEDKEIEIKVKKEKEEVINLEELQRLKEEANAKDVEFLPPSKIKPHPRNVEIYNTVTADDVQDILVLLGTIGQLYDIIIDDNNYIISGVRRWKAIQIYNQEEKKKKRQILNTNHIS